MFAFYLAEFCYVTDLVVVWELEVNFQWHLGATKNTGVVPLLIHFLTISESHEEVPDSFELHSLCIELPA